MMTLTEINAKIQEAITWMEISPTDSADYKREKRNLEFYRMCKLYILTNPIEDYLKEQVRVLEDRLLAIDRHYSLFQTNRVFETEKQKQNFYHAEMGVPDIKRKLQALKFLL